MKGINLLSKRERWGLTLYGWLILIIVVVLLFFVFVKTIVPFLSVEKRVEAKIMVLEGNVPDYAYAEVIKIFNEHDYTLMVTSGTSYDQGFYLSGVESAADLIKISLIKLGFDSTKLVAVPVPAGIHVNRTYNTALFTHDFIQENYPKIQKVNIVSLGVHSRRSHNLFKMVFEPRIEVGNIVIEHVAISQNNWYKTSRGFRTVLNECIAYIYVKLFFWPDEQNPKTKA